MSEFYYWGLSEQLGFLQCSSDPYVYIAAVGEMAVVGGMLTACIRVRQG